MAYEYILVEKEDGLATVTFNRARKLNAINPPMELELHDAVRKFAQDDTVRAVLFTGSGRAFAAGGDVRELIHGWKERSQNDLDDMVKEWDDFILDLGTLEKPTVAAVNGIAVGAGCNIAAACDVRIAAESAQFGQFFIRHGLAASDMGGTYFLPRLIGLGKTFELMYTGDLINAQEALKIGLVNRVVPDDEVLQTAKDLARRFAKGPTLAYALTKRTILRGLATNLATELDLERAAQVHCFKSEDYDEAMAAFVEKRAPNFKGR